MAWNDGLLPASFRGIPFFIDSHEKVGGRNAVSHEIPERENSFSEDLGRKAEGFNLTGHVMGDTYFFIRDALIEAVEKKDPGVLIHPYLGVITVQPGEYKFSEDNKEGRIARFQLNFVEAGEPGAFFGSIDKISSHLSNAVALVAQVENSINLTVAVVGFPGFILDSAMSVLQGFVDTVKSAISEISSDADNLTSINKKIDDFSSNLAASLKDPSIMFSNTNEILVSLKELPAEKDDGSTIDTNSGSDDNLSIFDDIIANNAEASSAALALVPLTPTREQEKVNNVAITSMINILAAVNKSEIAVDKIFKNEDSALVVREEINDILDSEMSIDTIDDNLFQGLKDIKGSLTELVPDPRKQLGTEKEVDLIANTNSLVFVYDTYGDLKKETDFLDLNGIQNPAFISGTIKVVTSG